MLLIDKVPSLVLLKKVLCYNPISALESVKWSLTIVVLTGGSTYEN